jgi:hypothetical protein
MALEFDRHGSTRLRNRSKGQFLLKLWFLFVLIDGSDLVFEARWTKSLRLKIDPGRVSAMGGAAFGLLVVLSALRVRSMHDRALMSLDGPAAVMSWAY